MYNKLNFNINNFGPINRADMKINQINIVGGINGSGKSFSSRLLFCFLTSFSDIGKSIENKGIRNSFESFIKRWTNNFFGFSVEYNLSKLNEELQSLMLNWNDENIDYDYLDNFFIKFKSIIEKYGLTDIDSCISELNSIEKTISVDRVKFGYVTRVMCYLLLAEFGQSQIKYFEDANISLNDDLKNFKFSLDFENGAFKSSFNNHPLLNDVIFNKIHYVDSRSLLDFNKLNDSQFHYYSLQKGLISRRDNNSIILEEVYSMNNNNNLESKLAGIMGGIFEFNEDKSEFIFKVGDKKYDILNVASGYKQLGILQLLLSNKYISEGNWLFIDEPETDLHPDMQIQLAELLIQMVKELDISLYVNSHSPYIIEAFEVYSKKYDLKDNTSFFSCEKQNNLKFDINEIDCDDLKILYDNLSEPYNTLNKVRFDNMWNEEFD